MLGMKFRHCACMCTPAVLYLRRAAAVEDMRLEEQLLRDAVKRLYITSADMTAMLKYTEWGNWLAVSHMLARCMQGKKTSTYPPTMQPFADLIEKVLRKGFCRFVQAATRVKIALCVPVSDPATAKETIVQLAAAAASAEMNKLCPQFLDKMASHGDRVERQVEESMVLVWARPQPSEASFPESAVPNNPIPPVIQLPPDMQQEMLEYAADTRRLAKAIYLVYRQQYAEMVEYTLGCVVHGLD